MSSFFLDESENQKMFKVLYQIIKQSGKIIGTKPEMIVSGNLGITPRFAANF